MFVSGTSHTDFTYICTHTCIIFQILFPYSLLQNIEYSSLRYRVGPCWLSILFTVVCFSLPQTADLSPSSHFRSNHLSKAHMGTCAHGRGQCKGRQLQVPVQARCSLGICALAGSAVRRGSEMKRAVRRNSNAQHREVPTTWRGHHNTCLSFEIPFVEPLEHLRYLTSSRDQIILSTTWKTVTTLPILKTGVQKNYCFPICRC